MNDISINPLILIHIDFGLLELLARQYLLFHAIEFYYSHYWYNFVLLKGII